MKLIGFLSILFTLQAQAFTVDYSRKASEFGVVGIASSKPASGPICQGLVLDSEKVIFRDNCADANGAGRLQYLVFADDLQSPDAVYLKIKEINRAQNGYAKATASEPFPIHYKKWSTKDFFDTSDDQNIASIQKMISLSHFGYVYNQGSATVIGDYRSKSENISNSQLLLAGSTRCEKLDTETAKLSCPGELALQNKVVSATMTQPGENRFRLVYYSKGVAFAASTPLFTYDGKKWSPVGESGEYQPMRFIKKDMSVDEVMRASGFGNLVAEYFSSVSKEAVYSNRSGYWINMIFDYKASGL